MKRWILLPLILLVSLLSAARTERTFELAKVWDQAWCLDKGRLIDHTSNRVVQQILQDPNASVPILISQISDRRTTGKEAICFWGKQSIGDMAFILFAELLEDQDGRAPVPELSWEGLVGGDGSIWSYAAYVKKHGYKGLQLKCRRAWLRHRNELRWDAKERCFRLK
jgi:hypothetical protein